MQLGTQHLLNYDGKLIPITLTRVISEKDKRYRGIHIESGRTRFVEFQSNALVN